MKSHKTHKTIFAAAVLSATTLGATQMARADLTISGATGLPLNPTAQMPPRGDVRVQANFSDLGNISGSDLNLGGIYAAGRAGDRLEISGGLENLNGDRFLNPLDKTNVALGAKYLIKPGGADGTSIAAGVGYSRALLGNKHAYVVGSRPMSGLSIAGSPAGAVHLGLRYDDFDVSGILPGRDAGRASVYGGVEVPASQKVSFVGELQSKNSDFGTASYPFSTGVRYRASERGLSGTVGYLREGVTGKSGLFAQVGKSF